MNNLEALEFLQLETVVVSSLFQHLNVTLGRDKQKFRATKFSGELGSKLFAVHTVSLSS